MVSQSKVIPAYRGFADTCEVFKATGNKLKATDLARRKSPSGFAWGYGGSGPAALAHSILADRYGKQAADKHFQQFKAEVIANLATWPDDMELPYSEVDEWAQANGISLKKSENGPKTADNAPDTAFGME